MKKKKITTFIFLFIPLFILLIISLMNMKKAGLLLSIYKNYFFKQTLWFLLGFLVLIIIYFIKPKNLFKYSKYLYFLNIILLILVLIFGKTINGSKAWFQFGFISFQPSELMKYTLALYLSEIASNIPKNTIKTELKFLSIIIFLTLIPSLFVFLEPDTGAIIIYILIMFGVIIAYNIRKRWYLIFGIILAIFIGLFFYLYYFKSDLLIKLIGTSFFYRVDRLLTFVNNNSFQLDRALIAIGTSSILPTNSYIYIPEAPTDFIIAFTINNFGIISFILVLISFLTLDIYFLIKYFKTKNLKSKMFIGAFILMFLFAEIENIGMNLGILPIIGLPLPFLSYGGTNILVYFIFLGTLIGLKEK